MATAVYKANVDIGVRMYHDSTDVPAAEAIPSPETAAVTVSRDMQ